MKRVRKQTVQPEPVSGQGTAGLVGTSCCAESPNGGTNSGYRAVPETMNQGQGAARASGLLDQLSVENSDSTGTGLPVATPVVETVATRDSFAQLRITQDSDSTSQLKYGRTAVQRVCIQWKVSRDTE